MDGTKIGFGHQLLIICLAYRKHYIPITWTWDKHVRGHNTTGKQLTLLSYVRRLLPTGAAALLIDHTEFGSVEVLCQLDRWQWFFIFRQKTSTHIWLNVQQGWQDFGNFVSKPSQSLWLGQSYLV